MTKMGQMEGQAWGRQQSDSEEQGGRTDKMGMGTERGQMGIRMGDRQGQRWGQVGDRNGGADE